MMNMLSKVFQNHKLNISWEDSLLSERYSPHEYVLFINKKELENYQKIILY